MTLQDIIDAVDGEDARVDLRIYCDCCHSGAWCNLLENQQVWAKKNGDIWVTVISACAHDEEATEMFFSKFF